MRCPACNADNAVGKKFCVSCGAGLAVRCSACGSPCTPGDAFCGECGTPVGESAAAAPSQPVAERRHISVLFADLVGFTTLSESRDSEEVRDLLSRYFENCRRLIERYGGTVEKFIGDAVMAVWGAPVAQEDDAERAVRAALELVAAVEALGAEVGAPGLKARVGVLSGEATVSVGARGQGMVAGDLVNTASRIQSAAEPGTVLAGEATKRASELAIAYEDAGLHELKGKSEPVFLWRALRVVAGARGAQRSSALEAPFVGRDRELRLVKELFHGAADDRRAQLVSVTGIAGIGKSRLAWEFEKYIDGLADNLYWHRGRCLSYGEGVAYWALAEMVRMRCDIVEDEEPGAAREKLRMTIEQHIPDGDERRWVEPRLAHLLGLEEGMPGDQENLFSAWRILFERLADKSPTILVFEDLQWADTGLLDFLEYLLEWSRNHPLFVLCLARPEFSDRRPTWGAGKRSVSSLYLDPLSEQAMSELLTGLVPGLPEDLRASIFARAEGVPLYAVETVRMLLDRGLLVREGHVYRPTGVIETLAVPETLHALVAARLDGLGMEERRVVQDAAVLGKTFTKAGLAALGERDGDEIEPVLAALLRKEIISVQADPRSPERGQYSFLQDIVKKVAYEVLSKTERKTKHLAAARYLSSSWGTEEDEIVEVVASHYLDAYRAAPTAVDADEIRDTARDLLVRAGERAASLGAPDEAQRAFERAFELTDDPLRQAELHERAGVLAWIGGRPPEASTHFEEAIALFEAQGATHPAARVEARLAERMWDRGRIGEGLARMDAAFNVLVEDEPDEDLAVLAAQVGRFMFFAGQPERAAERIETALDLAEALSLPEVLSQALTTKGIIITSRGRRREGLALVRYSLDLAREHDKPSAALRAGFNLAELFAQADRYPEAADTVREGLAFARKVGNRYWEWAFLGQVYPFFAVGAWDELLEMIEQLPKEQWLEARQAFTSVLTSGVTAAAHRGRLDDAHDTVLMLEELTESGDFQERSAIACGKALLCLVDERPAEALAFAERSMEAVEMMGVAQEYVKEAYFIAGEAALTLGDVAKVEELIAMIEALPPGRTSQFLQGHCLRLRARLAALRGDLDEVERLFKRAAARFRELGVPFYLGVTVLEHGEWLAAHDRADEAGALLAEAREVFAALEAAPWQVRVEQAAGVSAAT
jgi:class 3 adenylate cyclase/tetratricopeptide (TPR) repeat protein